MKENKLTSHKYEVTLIFLLFVLNLILRIPFYHHEIETDSFAQHILANSISQFGHANWWVNPLSTAGLYPYSVESAVPFIFSGIAQTTLISEEVAILLFSVFVGLLTAFAAYSLAGAIWDNYLFKFIVAFSFSTSPAVLNYLTWNGTSRGVFIGLTPIFLFCLLKSREDLRFLTISVVLFILLFFTHSLIFFLIPISLAYFISIMSYKLINHFKPPNWFITSSVVLCFMILASIPYFTGHFLEEASYYGAVQNFFLNLVRYAGVLVFFSIGGIVYLLSKTNKTFQEWSFILISLSITPLLLVLTYMKRFIPVLISLFVGIGIIRVLSLKRERRYATFIAIFLVISVAFSGFYQHWRTEEGIQLFDNYMKESTYSAGKWINHNIDSDSSLICNGRLTGLRIFSVAKVPLFQGQGAIDQTYGFVNVSEAELGKRTFTNDRFWYDGPYELLSEEPEIHRKYILRLSYRDYVSKYKDEFNFTHVIEQSSISGKFSYHGVLHSKFLEYVHTRSYIYENGKIGIWKL